MSIDGAEVVRSANASSAPNGYHGLPGLVLKKLDKKLERNILHAYRKDLISQVSTESDPVALLAKVVSLLYIKAIFELGFAMGSADLPSSSDPPERDREVHDGVEDSGIETGSGNVDLTKVDLKEEAPKWVSVAHDKRSLKKYEAEVTTIDGKNKVVIPDNLLSDATPLWEDFIVGKFLDISPHIAKVHMVVNKIWSYVDSTSKVEVFYVNATMMRFKIKNQKIREKILKRGMWNIAGVPMIVRKWTLKTEEEKQEEEVIPMWVHLRKVPLYIFSWEALSFMTSTVGFPVHLHPDTLACSNFEEAKIFVNVDVSKPLHKEIDFTIEGKEFTAEFYYPWLPSRCKICEKWVTRKKSV
ncbi:hypothetical protein Bca4012_020630 [Brassica carinata]